MIDMRYILHTLMCVRVTKFETNLINFIVYNVKYFFQVKSDESFFLFNFSFGIYGVDLIKIF